MVDGDGCGAGRVCRVFVLRTAQGRVRYREQACVKASRVEQRGRAAEAFEIIMLCCCKAQAGTQGPAIDKLGPVRLPSGLSLMPAAERACSGCGLAGCGQQEGSHQRRPGCCGGRKRRAGVRLLGADGCEMAAGVKRSAGDAPHRSSRGQWAPVQFAYKTRGAREAPTSVPLRASLPLRRSAPHAPRHC